jgi:hypothetical protein
MEERIKELEAALAKAARVSPFRFSHYPPPTTRIPLDPPRFTLA